MSSEYRVTCSPHLNAKAGTSNIMLDVVIALLPAAVVAVVVFGVSALITILVSVASSVVFEFLYNKIVKKPTTVGDLSAVVTGLLLAFCLPANLPVYMTVIGAFVSVVVVKQLFGGLGCNIANPAIVGRIVLAVSFPLAMVTFPAALDAVAGATPLSGGDIPSVMNMFIGNMPGSLGEVSALALIVGGVYLFARRVITPAIPLSFIGAVAAVALIAGQDPIYHLLTGGVILGALFMATDYVTSPTTTSGKVVYGIACGVLTMGIRITGSPEGVSYAILLMNILTPQIDSITRTKPLGGVTE